MSPKTQLWIARIVGITVLVVLGWMLLSSIPKVQQGGQYREIGVELGQRVQRTGRIPYNYKYIADYQTKLYWPNEEQYVNRIPKERRVYILDDDTLSQFKGYKRGGG